MSMPQAGDLAPEVALPDEHGTIHDLAERRGGWTVVYFYPADDTPGLHHRGLPVPRPPRRAGGPGRPDLGHQPRRRPAATPRSAPSSACRSRSCPTRTTPSPSAYGAWGEKKNYGKTYMGIIRSSFLVDPDGPASRRPGRRSRRTAMPPRSWRPSRPRGRPAAADIRGHERRLRSWGETSEASRGTLAQRAPGNRGLADPSGRTIARHGRRA